MKICRHRQALRSCVAGNDPRYRSRRRHRYTCCRDQSRHIAVPDGLSGREWWVLDDLLAPRCAQSPVRAHVVRVFRQEKLYCPLVRTQAEREIGRNVPVLLRSLP